jgi:hypothetical protein
MSRTFPTLLMALALTACSDSTGSEHETGARPPAATFVTPEAVESAPPAHESMPCGAGVQRELMGTRHGIVGHSFVWPHPFRSPPLPDRHNKILWELERPGHAPTTADLLITASLNDSETVVHRRVEGRVTPGRTRPSIIDVPQRGCWTFSLAWGTERDTVAVRYRRSG